MQRRKLTYKLYPSATQSALLQDILRQHKDLWNAALQERIDAWRKAGKSISYEDQCASLTQIRGELPDDWALMNCSSQQITLRRLNKAFQSFFRRVKAGQAPGFPRFKSLNRMPGFGYKGHGDGWRFTPAIVTKNGRERWQHGTLRLQGVGHIKARGMARTGGTIKSCELLHTRGEWHLSLTIECEPFRDGGSEVLAADWGTEKLLSLMNSAGIEERIENPRWYQAGKDRQAELDRAVARKKRGSAAWRRAKRASARFKAKQARIRLDSHHKLAGKIAKRAGLFVTEALSVKNMTASASGTVEEPGTRVAQKRGLNREILDTAPVLLFALIAYKVQETGGRFMKAPTRKLKPSQRCPACWKVAQKRLDERVHACPCGCVMDRDMASAKVLLRWVEEEFGAGTVPGGESRYETPSITA